MFELVVSFACHMLPLIGELATLLKDLPEEVKKMRDELQKIQTFIYKADRTSAVEEDKEKLKQLVERAFRLEDIIDEYMISEPASFIQTMSLRFQIAYKIKHFKWLQERSEKDDGFTIPFLTEPGASSSGGSKEAAVQNLQLAPHFLKEDEVVGFESSKERLIDWLVNGRRERTVISVVAMGGQGKTTLAKQVFNNEQVIGHFTCRVWVTVSQSYTANRLLGEMLLEFAKENMQHPLDGISTMDRESLINEVRKYLQGKRYVVFFDDVWNTHFWDDIELALIDDNVGSRVFITTRDMSVANSCKKSSLAEVHDLRPLTEEKSLELFYRKAFFELNGSCPQNLRKICSEIVSKCKGLPLAIVAIGGVLASKERNVSDWETFRQNLSSELEMNPNLDSIGKILGFSYDNLSPYLKPCLLYFGMYPEDYEVRTTRLTKQWVAEGFVKEERGKSLERVAQGYLTELIQRSLVHASSLSIDGRVKGSRVHDLLREMIHKKIEDLSFAHFISEDDPLASSQKRRRLSIATNFNSFTTSIGSSHHIRSLLFFIKNKELPVELFMEMILTNHKLLKVLDLENSFLDHAPEILGTLIHLKYLSFKGTYIKSLPQSIGKLGNLETLDLRSSYSVPEIPKEISKLTKLRHLMSRRGVMISSKDVIGSMTSLQTLHIVSLDDGEAIKELEKLKQLKVLGLSDVKEEDGSALCSLLNKMQHLEKLVIELKSGQAIDLHHHHHVSNLSMLLRVLRLDGKLLNGLPEWIPKLQNLVKLKLTKSSLTVDPFKSLENMPNLLSLQITVKAYIGAETLRVHDGGFPKLKELQLEWNYWLKSFCIDEGALPSLENLLLSGYLKAPKGIQNMKSLKHIDCEIWFEHGFYDLITYKPLFAFEECQHVALIQVTHGERILERWKFGQAK